MSVAETSDGCGREANSASPCASFTFSLPGELCRGRHLTSSRFGFTCFYGHAQHSRCVGGIYVLTKAWQPILTSFPETLALAESERSKNGPAWTAAQQPQPHPAWPSCEGHAAGIRYTGSTGSDISTAALAALLAQMSTGAPPSEPEMPGPQLRAPSSASADGSRNVPAQPGPGDRRRKLIPVGGYARVWRGPGRRPGHRSRVSRIGARDFTGAARLPGARH